MNGNSNILLKIDWLLVIIYATLVIFGLFSIYSVEQGRGDVFSLSFTNGYIKQGVFALISIVLGALALLIDSRFYQAIAYSLYTVIVLLILIVAFWGIAIGGTQGWLDLGFFRLQPSEFGKLATALVLARFLTTYDVSISRLRDLFIALLLIALPIAFILLQGDFGTSLIYLAFGMMLFRQGMHSFLFFLPLWLGILFLATLLFDEVIVIFVLTTLAILVSMIARFHKQWIISSAGILIVSIAFVFAVDYTFENVLQHHHKQRINVLIGKEVDIRGAGYNVHQSIIAIGSGGITGQGYRNGTQTQFDFIPEQNTDFIFCAIAEEHGFTGSIILLLLYLVFLLRIIFLAEYQKEPFVKIYGYGIASVIFMHVTINIAMTIGLFPVVGIPLPFVSYGGSSLLAFTLMLFIYLRMHAQAQEIYY